MFRLPNCNCAEIPLHFSSLHVSGLGSGVPGGVLLWCRALLHAKYSNILTAREYFSPRVHYFLYLCPGVKLAEIRVTAFIKSHSNIVKIFKQNKSDFHFIIEIFALL